MVHHRELSPVVGIGFGRPGQPFLLPFHGVLETFHPPEAQRLVVPRRHEFRRHFTRLPKPRQGVGRAARVAVLHGRKHDADRFAVLDRVDVVDHSERLDRLADRHRDLGRRRIVRQKVSDILEMAELELLAAAARAGGVEDGGGDAHGR